MKLQKNTLKVMCGSMAVVLATVSAAAATADFLPELPVYSQPSDMLPQTADKTDDSADLQADSDAQESDQEENVSYLGKKSETVYVNLNADGSPRETIVSDWLHSDTPGAELPDRTDLSDVTNVKGTETPQKDGNSLKWKLDGTDLYYRGTTDKPLPLEISITYSLDGKELPPDELAGKSGKMEMKMQFHNTTSNKVMIAGKETKMHTPLMAIVAMSLSDDHFSNVQLSDGNITADGSNQAVSILCMPGLADSLALGKYSMSEINDLDFPEKFTITADVNEFEMGPIGIAVTSELPNLDEIKKSDDFDDMRGDLYDLQDMQDDLDRADPDRDLRSLITSPQRTEAAQLLVDDIFKFYDVNKDILDILPKYITEDNIKLYDRVKYDLKDSTLDTLLDDDVVFDLLDRVDELSPAKLQSLMDDFDDMEMKALRVLMNRCNELTAALGNESAQKNMATLQKMAACREPMFALLGDVQNLDDSTFRTLLYSSIAAQIPGTGKIADAPNGTALSGLLQMLLPSLKKEIESNMESTSVITGLSASKVALNSAVPAVTLEPESVSSSIQEEPAASETESSSEASGEGESSSSTSEEAESSSSTPEEAENSSSSETEDEAEPSSDASEMQSNDTAESASEENSSDETAETSNDDDTTTSVLAAYVESSEDARETSSETVSSEEASDEPSSEASSEDSATEEEETQTISASSIEPQTSTISTASLKAMDALSSTDPTNREKILVGLNSVFLTSSEEQFDATCDSLSADSSFAPLIKLRTHTLALKESMATNGITEADDLSGALNFAGDLMTQLDSLTPLVKDCFAPLLKNVTDETKQAQIIQSAMEKLTNDLMYNQENLTTLVLLTQQLKDADLDDDIEYIDDLRKDMQDLRPIVKKLNRDLKRSDISVSLHKSPETTTTMLQMKDDLENHRDISESLRWAMLPQNVDIGRSMIDTLDRLQNKDAVGSSINKVNDADELLDRKEALMDLSDQYQIFTDAPAELETSLKFIMKTDEIDAPEKEEEPVSVEEDSGGFLNWIKGIFSGATGSKESD